jgi:phage antirepressor YoqD-like protein
VVARTKVIKRWQELEQQASKPIDPMALFSDPAAMLQLATSYAKRIIEADAVIAEQAPKVEALARLSESNGSLCLTDAAKTLKIPRHKLITYLSTTKHIYKRGGVGNWIAYQPKVLEHRTVIIQRGDGTETNKSQVLITPKGLVKFAKVFSGASAK